MAEASNFTSECDAESLKRLLNETASACQKCLVAVDSVATSQQQASLSTPHSTIVSLCRVLCLVFCVTPGYISIFKAYSQTFVTGSMLFVVLVSK